MSEITVDLKNSINLPKTPFSMKANLPTAEPRMLEKWEGENLYQRIRDVRQGRPEYVLHDGPPYANGNIHLGTAFNKILKDFIVKSKSMAGFDAPYVPGWDCHGLPIEIKVDNELGKRKASMSVAEIRGECRAYAAKYVNIHRTEFKRLGILGRWENPYLTMSAEYESVIAKAFVDFLHNGYVYKGLKPVHWCIKDRTALAEAEVEYENHLSPSIYVRFQLASDPAVLHPDLAGRTVSALIWTTTPWTIPANLAISFNPKFDYVAVDTVDGITIVAEGLLDQVSEALGWDKTILARFPGPKLDRLVFRHPFLDRDSLGLLGDHVTLEQGTGAVHTAPGHGQDDFVIGQRYGLSVYCPVDASGRIFRAEGAPGLLPDELIGKTVWEANSIVIELLKSRQALAGQANVNHSYPHCWRCHNPVIFRATDQWFIGLDREELRAKTLAAIKKVQWHPSWGDDRMTNMIAMRPDWCISRQRVWGVPIVVFYCESCTQPYTDRQVQNSVVEKFAQHTSDIWYSSTVEQLMGSDCRCDKCGGTQFRKETDILDVWFDSGSSSLAVLTPANQLPWPADMYIEGGDQYRGWFHSSLLIGVGLRGQAPYKECATHGWTLDEHGRAMHKSLGNTIEPETIVKKYGADILRLWVASVDFSEDVRLSDTILTRLSEAYRKLRNTFRYMLGNLHDFRPAEHRLPVQELLGIDTWILARLDDLTQRCLGFYSEYAFHKVYRAIYDFAITDLSNVYFDILKDRLYTSGPHSPARRSAQTALHHLNLALTRLLAPILSFTCQEVWEHSALPADVQPNIHMDLFPAAENIPKQPDYDQLVELREGVLKALDQAREDKVIGSSLEAAVTLQTTDLLARHEAELPSLFIVSAVQLTADQPVIKVERARGDKCDRCWKYTLDVGSDSAYPNVCAACAKTLREYF